MFQRVKPRNLVWFLCCPNSFSLFLKKILSRATFLFLKKKNSTILLNGCVGWLSSVVFDYYLVGGSRWTNFSSTSVSVATLSKIAVKVNIQHSVKGPHWEIKVRTPNKVGSRSFSFSMEKFLPFSFFFLFCFLLSTTFRLFFFIDFSF